METIRELNTPVYVQNIAEPDRTREPLDDLDSMALQLRRRALENSSLQPVNSDVYLPLRSLKIDLNDLIGYTDGRDGLPMQEVQIIFGDFNESKTRRRFNLMKANDAT